MRAGDGSEKMTPAMLDYLADALIADTLLQCAIIAAEREPCPWCMGSGVVHTWDCTHCLGAGTVPG